jgi:Na+/proline symporter
MGWIVNPLIVLAVYLLFGGFWAMITLAVMVGLWLVAGLCIGGLWIWAKADHWF